MEAIPTDQHQHHPFPDLDVHHDVHTDDEEALEAIRVAIGQTNDFDTDPLHDVGHHHVDTHAHAHAHNLDSIPQMQTVNDQQHPHPTTNNGTSLHPQLTSGHDSNVSALHPTLANQTQTQIQTQTTELPSPTSVSAIQIQSGLFEKGLKAIIDLGFSNEVLLDSIKNPEHVDTVKTIVEDVKKKSDIAKSLLTQVQNHAADFMSNIDPSLHAQYVSKSDYDTLKARLDATSGDSKHVKSTSLRTKKRPRPSVTPVETPGDLRERSSTPMVDEKGRKKRSMKLEHLIHQMANRRLGIEYNVSGFESKGGRELPSPDSTPKSAAESVNGVEEFRPDFRQDVTSLTVKPFIEQVAQDVLEAWEAGVGKGEFTLSVDKVKESAEVYWLRLGKRWDEQTIRAAGGIHKDELVRRKQNQYRRQQSLVARRQASFDKSPLNVCKLRSLYRTLLTIDFAARTEERPNPARNYTEDEWYAYRKLQHGTRENEAHEVMDIYWLSPFVRAALCVLDVFSTDQNARIKRKGKPKTPAPGFHLPSDLWDHTPLPALRPKNEDGLPLPQSQGIVLFRFHVDEQVIKANPEWAEGLYDNPPIPEGDALLPQLNQVMDATVYQHLRPLVKYTRDSMNIARLTSEQIREVLDSPDDTHKATIAPMVDAFANVHPPTAGALEQGGINLDLSLETLVSMTQNSYMATNPLANQLALAAMESHSQDESTGTGTGTGNGAGAGAGAGAPSGAGVRTVKMFPGSSQQARKMGKRTASVAPGGAVEPVPKRIKGQPYTWQSGQEAPDKDLGEDAGFVFGL